MDLGVIFPTTAIGTDPAVIRDFAQTAEGLGYRRLLTYDHVLGAVHADRDPGGRGSGVAGGGRTILSVQTMQSGTGYQRVMHHRLGTPAAHIAALGEFAGVLRG